MHLSDVPQRAHVCAASTRTSEGCGRGARGVGRGRGAQRLRTCAADDSKLRKRTLRQQQKKGGQPAAAAAAAAARTLSVVSRCHSTACFQNGNDRERVVKRGARPGA